MKKRSFQTSLSTNELPVLVELASGPDFDVLPVMRFLKEAAEVGYGSLPKGYKFAGITVPENPNGSSSPLPLDVLGRINNAGLLEGLDFVPHITCKDHNSAALRAMLAAYYEAGIESLLLLTGDKPAAARKVFELDSIGLLEMVRKENDRRMRSATAESLKAVRCFFAGVAVNPFKYTEPSQMQQYYKLEKKIAAGARFVITQVGWDWRKSLGLFRYLKDNSLEVSVVGNVYYLGTHNAAARLMRDGKLAGCYLSPVLYEKIMSESAEDHIARAAQQMAMYKSIGASAIDISGVPDYQTFARIVSLADQIGQDWELFKDNLYFPPPDRENFYLYDQSGKRMPLSRPKTTLRVRTFDFMHRTFFQKDRLPARAITSMMSMVGIGKGRGFFYRAFNTMEKAFKYAAFDCQECGDCFLPENFGYCSLGGCEKGLPNPPCGDADPQGNCGSDPGRVCIGEKIYLAAAAQLNGRDRLRATQNAPRKASLEHSSSIANYYFGRDHTMQSPIIAIGEAVHASIPNVAVMMKQLHTMGAGAYTNPSPELEYIRSLISSQADEGAAYIAVNVDAFGEDDPAVAVTLMVEYVRLVRRYGRGVPVCIDSSNDDVLIGGLRQWYSDVSGSIARPLINSVKLHTVEKILPLKKEYDFSVIGLLVSNEPAAGPGGMHTADQLLEAGVAIVEAARANGFKSDEVFLDPTVFPLAIDMPMEPGAFGYTYRTFELIRKIRNHPNLRGVHISLGISNAVRDLPARKIGILRAYVKLAVDSGLDAGIINVFHHYGQVEPDPVLVELVEAFTGMDGSGEKTNQAMELMGKFCRENKKG